MFGLDFCAKEKHCAMCIHPLSTGDICNIFYMRDYEEKAEIVCGCAHVGHGKDFFYLLKNLSVDECSRVPH
jgi:hypothetical protein